MTDSKKTSAEALRDAYKRDRRFFNVMSQFDLKNTIERVHESTSYIFHDGSCLVKTYNQPDQSLETWIPETTAEHVYCYFDGRRETLDKLINQFMGRLFASRPNQTQTAEELLFIFDDKSRILYNGFGKLLPYSSYEGNMPDSCIAMISQNTSGENTILLVNETLDISVEMDYRGTYALLSGAREAINSLPMDLRHNLFHFYNHFSNVKFTENWRVYE